MPTIYCPKCKQIYKVEPGIIGQEVECTVCNTTFIATEASAPAVIKLQLNDSSKKGPPQKAMSSESVSEVKTEHPFARKSLLLCIELANRLVNTAKKIILKTIGFFKSANIHIFKEKKIVLSFLAFSLLFLASFACCTFFTNKNSRVFQKGREAYEAGEYETAVLLFTTAAEKGHTDAQYMLAECFYYGKGVKKDEEKALDWYEKAANSYRIAGEKGDAEAQFRVGKYYDVKDYCLSGQFNADRNLLEQLRKEATKWFKMSAENGNPNGQYRYGMKLCMNDDRDYFSLEVTGAYFEESEGIKWIRKAAEQGLSDAQFYLGMCLYEGLDVRSDKKEAFAWFTKAAEQGDAEAQYRLGQCYRLGAGTGRNMTEAFHWYQKAAEQGNSQAKTALKELGY